MVNAALDKEKFSELQKYIDGMQGQKGILMPTMQKAQDIFGYLPIEVQKFIAENLIYDQRIELMVIAQAYKDLAKELKTVNS